MHAPAADAEARFGEWLERRETQGLIGVPAPDHVVMADRDVCRVDHVLDEVIVAIGKFYVTSFGGEGTIILSGLSIMP
jgi:hypothetical protein